MKILTVLFVLKFLVNLRVKTIPNLITKLNEICLENGRNTAMNRFPLLISYDQMTKLSNVSKLF